MRMSLALAGLMVTALAAGVLATNSRDVEAGGTTYIVDTDFDGIGVDGCMDAVDDDCSLRGAVSKANGNAGHDTVTFQIDSGLQTIALILPLPDLTDPVTIDGTTQPGGGATPRIELSGAGAGDGANGLVVKGGDSTVRGLIINGFGMTLGGVGIRLDELGGNVVQGNYIGTDATGTIAVPNRIRGVQITSPNNLVGGSNVEDRNVISGNNERGVYISGAENGNNTIRGNYIGVDATGLEPLGNRSEGVAIHQSPLNVIGGSDPGDGNVIAGNSRNTQTGSQIRLFRDSADENLIEGNFIGTDRTGSEIVPVIPLGGAGGPPIPPSGIVISGLKGLRPQDNAIRDNVISGNGGDGITLLRADGTVITANKVGTSANGFEALGNGESGIELEDAVDTRIGDIPGGIDSAETNIIANNTLAGVDIVSGSGNSAYGNSIYDNGELGVDLGSDGRTPNDDEDADSGANELQNYPELVEVSSGGGQTHIEGTFNSAPNTQFQIQYFTNETCDPSGYGEGWSSFAGTSRTTDADGDATINETYFIDIPTDSFVTAMATDSDGNSSEFSNCVEVEASAEPTPTPSPTGEPTETPQPTPTTTPTPPPGTIPWGDNQCDGDVDPVDALADLRNVAALPATPQTEPCPDVGTNTGVTPAGATERLWGDIDCDGDVDPVDALAILRHAADLPPLSHEPDCPELGAPVLI